MISEAVAPFCAAMAIDGRAVIVRMVLNFSGDAATQAQMPPSKRAW